jgi:hypothetical protein
VALDVKLNLSLPIAPAGNCVRVMHHRTSTLGIVETPYILIRRGGLGKCLYCLFAIQLRIDLARPCNPFVVNNLA